MIGRHRDQSSAELRLARMEAAVDQVLVLVRDTATQHKGNLDLVNLALDVTNELNRARQVMT